MSQIVSALFKSLTSKLSTNKNAFLALKIGVAVLGYIFNHISIGTAVVLLALFLFIRFFLGSPDCDLILSFTEKFGKSTSSLKGNVVWITGASTGIGEAIAYELAQAKVRLVLSARSEDKLQNVKKRCIEIGSLKDNDVLVVPFDMTDYSKHEWAFSTVVDHFGRIDILVSNAGRGQMALWQNIDVAVDKALFELNVFSLLSLARMVTKHFISEGGGKHVVMSSAAAIAGNPFASSYSASKFAINGYFETLRLEKGNKGISVNVICPGPVQSNIDKGLIYAKLEQKEKSVTRTTNVMPTKRCAELSVIAIANNLKEVWISECPILIYMYLFQYCPSFMKWLCHNIDLSASVKKLDD